MKWAGADQKGIGPGNFLGIEKGSKFILKFQQKGWKVGLIVNKFWLGIFKVLENGPDFGPF